MIWFLSKFQVPYQKSFKDRDLRCVADIHQSFNNGETSNNDTLTAISRAVKIRHMRTSPSVTISPRSQTVPVEEAVRIECLIDQQLSRLNNWTFYGWFFTKTPQNGSEVEEKRLFGSEDADPEIQM